MFPSPFDYHAPTTVDEALSLLAEHGDDAKVLAGGQSLIPLLKLRFAAPTVIVDISRIPGLDQLAEAGGMLRVGALVRNRTIVRSDLIAERYPTVSTAAPLISDPIVRNLGTLVGSLCHADPQGDYGSVLLALGGEVVARSQQGERRIPIGEFFEGPFTTALRPDELAVEARLPEPAGDVFGTYLKLERKVGDFATVGVAIWLTRRNGTTEQAGIALTGVGATNIKATEAEQALVGRPLDGSAIEEAARLAAAAGDPKSDHRGSAEYKRHMVAEFVTRGLGRARSAVTA